jgi:16S rRNA G527 N7-methylase RsmG
VTEPAGRSDPAGSAALARAVDEARRLGFFGPRPAEEQIAHAWAMVGLIEDAGVSARAFLDLGSGGGLPGLVVAAAWPDATGALLDASVRRCAFLREALSGLGWHDRIDVLEGRGEGLARRPDLRAAFPLVIARSFGSPAVTAEIGSGFLALGGSLVVSEPAATDGRWPEDGLRRLGLVVGDRRRASGAGIVVLRRVAAIDDGFPRANGTPAKRPLW